MSLVCNPPGDTSQWIDSECAAPILSDALHEERCDIYLALSGVPNLKERGFLVTEKGNPNAVIAFCPLPPGENAPGMRTQLEIYRQLRIAARIAEHPETAEHAVDAIYLGWIGKLDRAAPHWLYGLSCIPLTADWNGRFVNPRPFCPHLFEEMASQPNAVAWLRRWNRKQARKAAATA